MLIKVLKITIIIVVCCCCFVVVFIVAGVFQPEEHEERL